MNGNIADIEFERYNTILTFAAMRNYTPDSEPYTILQFVQEMQLNKYIKMRYTVDEKPRPVIIFFLAKNSEFARKSADLKNILNRIREPANVILISDSPISRYGMKAIVTYARLTVKTLSHDNFIMTMPNGPLCFKHRIMSADETMHLLNVDLKCHLVDLPKIFASDVQCVWIGAEVGDVVAITMRTDVNGESMKYCAVVPRHGKIVLFSAVHSSMPFTPDTLEEKDDVEEEDGDTSDESYDDDFPATRFPDNDVYAFDDDEA